VREVSLVGWKNPIRAIFDGRQNQGTIRDDICRPSSLCNDGRPPFTATEKALSQNTPMSADAHDLEAVRRILDAHRQQITRRYDAVGTGIGKDGSDYVITVYLKDASHQSASEVSIEGVRLKFVVTGPFRPHSDSQAR
jgi:hypothetical protein